MRRLHTSPPLKNPTPEVAAGAAKWWREQIDGRRPAGRDNGASREPGNPINSPLGATLLLMSAMSVPRVDVEKYDVFEKDLTALILRGPHRSELHTDYRPSASLAAIAKRHGISEDAFPWKTHMHVHELWAESGLGYGAPYIVVAGVRPWNDSVFSDGHDGKPDVRISVSSEDGKLWMLDTGFRDPATDRSINFVVEGEAAARVGWEQLKTAAWAVARPCLPWMPRGPADEPEENRRLRVEENKRRHKAHEDEIGTAFLRAMGEVVA